MQKKLQNFSNNSFCRVFRATLFFIVLFSSCFFYSCKTLDKAVKASNKLHLYPAKKLHLMSTSEFQGEPIAKEWNAVVTKKDGEKYFTIYLEADQESFSIKIADRNGENVSHISYIDDRIEDLKWSEGWAVSAEESIAIFQCCFYDVNAVALMLNSINVRLAVEMPENSGEEIRRFYNKRNCIIKIEKKVKHIFYKNYEKKISIELSEI